MEIVRVREEIKIREKRGSNLPPRGPWMTVTFSSCFFSLFSLGKFLLNPYSFHQGIEEEIEIAALSRCGACDEERRM